MKLLYAILHVVIVAVSVMAIIVPPEAPATNAKNMKHDSVRLKYFFLPPFDDHKFQLNATNMHRLVNSPNMASRDVLATCWCYFQHVAPLIRLFLRSSSVPPARGERNFC